MAQREGVEKGRHVPSRHTIKELLKDKQATERQAAQTREWIQQGMKEDKK
jgi:glutathione S-transferase